MINFMNLDIRDYEEIYSHQGKIEGRINSCKISSLIRSLDEDFKTSLGNAKAIAIEFEYNKDEIPIKIFEAYEEICLNANEHAIVIFAKIISNNLELGSINYKIIATGILV
ncbi:MAG: hypothetical protein PHW94_03885 [Sulfurimonas sp.]|nr:hypothetical protein [Sulfurimonas sp.]